MGSVFQIKDFEAVKASMLNLMFYSDNALTDANVGAVMRSLVEAVAMEQEEMYFRTWQGIQSAIPASIMASFDFVQIMGTYASGSVTFGRDTAAPADYVIPTGTLLLGAGGAQYKTTAQVTLLTGATSIVAPIIAAQIGSSSNNYTPTVDGNPTPLQIITSITGISFCTMATQFTGGSDTETIESLQSRFKVYINSLSRGTLIAVVYGALSAQYNDGANIHSVLAAKAVDYTATPGLVDVYIDDGMGTASEVYTAQATGTPTRGSNTMFTLSGDFTSVYLNSVKCKFVLSGPSTVYSYVQSAVYSAGTTTVTVYDAVITTTITTLSYMTDGLVYQAKKVIDGYVTTGGVSIEGYKAAGVRVLVHPVTPINVTITAVLITASAFNNILPYIQSALTNYFNSLTLGQPVYMTKLTAIMYAAHPDVKDVTMSLPSADITPTNSERAILYSMTGITGSQG